ncbi:MULTISPECIES: lactonase family protein [Pseudomonas]|uniref:Lactonase family protein n=2 Tax=Pseudomonas TaxID=286 RepID=A0A7X1G2R2_9PSED|nr:MULTISPECIES: lactonase family protein [Pseudomonas]MBC2677407.1 lactonase family protein [Pseudomonas baltica]MBD8729868.1 lactonase family protein [Pseudomonas sp. CFBP 13710]
MRKHLLLAAAIGCAGGLAQASTFAYISSPEDGMISQYRLDENTGSLTLVHQTHAGDQVNPMALSPDGSTLYAALRVKPFRVMAYRIDPASGQLDAAAEAPLAASLAYLSTDRTGRYLMGASYGGNVLTVQPIDAEHRPGEDIKVYPTGPYAHSVRSDPSNRFVYAGNLGVDQVLQFTLDDSSGTLEPIGNGHASVTAGSGPRHIAFAPGGKFLYVVGELSGTVDSFSIDAQTGALTKVAHVEGVPKSLNLVHGEIRNAGNNDLKDDPTPRIWAADIRVSPDGQLIYITERTTSSVSAFKADPASGTLSFQGNYPLQEKQPRNIAFSPSGRWLLVTGEKADKVGSYAVGAAGALTRTAEAPSGKGALWIEMLNLPGA